MATILVVDDQRAARTLLRHTLADEHAVLEADGGDAALRTLATERVDLVLLDLHLPPDVGTAREGVRVQRAIADMLPRLPVVVITGDQDRGLAVEMVHRGVADFLLKPIDATVLKIVVARALERAKLVSEVAELKARLGEPSSFGNLIARDPAMTAVFAKLARLAHARASVLFLGESGSGKSAAARALHDAGPRAGRPFVVVDGATIPESLIESELFGHARGAYTGADAPRTGRVRMADGGTLFLDEVGNLSPAAQAKLLLFLDDRAYTPVGSNERVEVDVRFIAATNRDLQELVERGEFREDLLFRLQVATIALPPLRERREDIAPLAERFLVELGEGATVRLTPQATVLLESYSWPGNVRQLRHVLETALVLADGDTLDADDLALPAASVGRPAPTEARAIGFKQRVVEFERRMLGEALERCGGNKAAAGRLLGLDKNRMSYLCKKHGL